jgi:hypothetical protein
LFIELTDYVCKRGLVTFNIKCVRVRSWPTREAYPDVTKDYSILIAAQRF